MSINMQLTLGTPCYCARHPATIGDLPSTRSTIHSDFGARDDADHRLERGGDGFDLEQALPAE